MQKHRLAVAVLGVLASASVVAQESDAPERELEEVIVVGSQIRGANIVGALPVSVISVEDIDATGVDSGDDLLEYAAEPGQN